MIAIYTPMTQASAIGRVNAFVADELVRRGTEVTLVRCEHPRDGFRFGPVHPSLARLDDAAKYDENPAAFANAFDAVFYNLGDQHSFHYFAIRHALVQPGIAILHDLNLINALYGYGEPDPQRLGFRQVMLESDDAELRRAPDIDSPEFPEWFKQAMARRPTFEWALIRANGCLTHSRFAAEIVRRSTGLIVAATPLPLVPRTSIGSHAVSAGERVRLITIGHINGNKRVQSVAAAIARSPELRASCEYHVVGPVEPEVQAQIETAGRVAGEPSFITFHGRVDDATLDSLLASAQIACCLRWPALEAGSLSCIEVMACGLPTVVTDTGVYAEIPDDCVLKIDPARELDDIEDALLQLIRSPERRAAIGAAGKAYVATAHSAQQYADELLDLAKRVLAARPVLRVIDQLGSTMADLGVDAQFPVVSRVAQAVDSMFGSAAEGTGEDQGGWRER